MDHEVRSSRLAWPRWQTPVSIKNTKISWAQWQAPVIQLTLEAEAGELLEPQGMEVAVSQDCMPLHSKLGDRVRLRLKKRVSATKTQRL